MNSRLAEYERVKPCSIMLCCCLRQYCANQRSQQHMICQQHRRRNWAAEKNKKCGFTYFLSVFQLNWWELAAQLSYGSALTAYKCCTAWAVPTLLGLLPRQCCHLALSIAQIRPDQPKEICKYQPEQCREFFARADQMESALKLGLVDTFSPIAHFVASVNLINFFNKIGFYTLD